MTFLNKTGVTLTLVAGGILAGLQGCTVTTTDEIVTRELARFEAGIWVYGSEGRVPHLCGFIWLRPYLSSGFSRALQRIRGVVNAF